MTGFFMFLHAAISVLLVVVILMQSGRGGGLTEGFASAESMFGAQTNEFMIKATTVFASLFLLTSLGLAVVSAQKGKSLMASSGTPGDQVLPIEETLESDILDGDSAVTVSDLEKLPMTDQTISIKTGAEESRQQAGESAPVLEKLEDTIKKSINKSGETQKLDVIPEVTPPKDSRQKDAPSLTIPVN